MYQTIFPPKPPLVYHHPRTTQQITLPPPSPRKLRPWIEHSLNFLPCHVETYLSGPNLSSFPPISAKGCAASFLRLILPPQLWVPSLPPPAGPKSINLPLSALCLLPLPTCAQHPVNMNDSPPSWRSPPQPHFSLQLPFSFSSFLSSQSSWRVVCTLSSLPQPPPSTWRPMPPYQGRPPMAPFPKGDGHSFRPSFLALLALRHSLPPPPSENTLPFGSPPPSSESVFPSPFSSIPMNGSSRNPQGTQIFFLAPLKVHISAFLL